MDEATMTAATTYEFLKLERDGGIAVLTLARPDNLNAWNRKMRDELREAVASLVGDDGLRVLVITGAGRAFSAGEDVRGMKGLAEIGTRGFRRVVRGIHNVFDEIEAMEVPVIAAINGVAAGGGLELALSCDFRFASASAKMGFPENNVGLIPGSGGCSRLVKLVGLAKAKRLVMTGEIIPAARALEFGLVDEVHAADQLMERTMEYVADLVTNSSPTSISVMKQQVYADQMRGVVEASDDAIELMRSSLRRGDFTEGVASFLQKRPPKFAPLGSAG